MKMKGTVTIYDNGISYIEQGVPLEEITIDSTDITIIFYLN